jgi:hypothetical protein
LEALAPPILPLLTRPGGTPADRSSTNQTHGGAGRPGLVKGFAGAVVVRMI